MKVFLKGYVSGSLAAPSLSSPILNTLTFSAAVLFCGSGVPDFFHAPIDQGSPSGPLQDVGPASRSLGAFSPVSPPPSPGPISSFSGPGVGLGGSHSLWQVVHCSPPPSALRGPVHRSRSVPPTAYICGGFRVWLFTTGGARAPRHKLDSEGGCPPGRSLDSTCSPLGREQSLWATLGPSRFLCPREPLS